MKKFFIAAVCGAAALFFAGCAPKYVLSNSDLTVKELEQKMSRALDPKGRFAKAQRFIQRFEVKTSTGWLEPPTEEFVEVKFAAPGNFKVTTSDDKGVHYGYIFNETGGYMIDYRKKSARPLQPQTFAHLRTMREIADPVMDLSTVFKFIDIKRGSDGENQFYILNCKTTPDSNPLEFVISADTCRLHSLSGKIKIGSAVLDYSSRVVNYSLVEGMRVAELTESVTNGIKTQSKLIYFKLDPYFAPDEFKIPVF